MAPLTGDVPWIYQDIPHTIFGDLYLSFIVDTCRLLLLTNHNNGDLTVIQWYVMGLILW